MRTILLAILATQCVGCAHMGAHTDLRPPTQCFASYDHVSHPLLGRPFGSRTEEDTIDSTGITCRWGQGRVFFESGLSYMLWDNGFKNDQFLYNGRIGVTLWERKR